jgi:hypothetical protein
MRARHDAVRSFFLGRVSLAAYWANVGWAAALDLHPFCFDNGWRNFHFGRQLMQIGRARMRFEPQRASLEHRINTSLLPPCCFIAVAMDFAMMPTTQRHGEFIADLASECPALREPQVVGIARLSTANQTRLFGHTAAAAFRSAATNRASCPV